MSPCRSKRRTRCGADPRLRRDSERIERRLAIRENGRCILGFTELEKQQAALK
jgi:hypothetical protein